MEVKGSIFKRKDGSKITWWARVRYVDPETGKVKDLQRRATSKTNAGDERDKLLNDIKATAGRSVGSERMTFGELCTYYENHYAKEAEYVEGRKIAGLRSLATVKGQIQTLKDYFGERPIRSLTYANIRQFRSARFKAKTRSGTQRSIASVNRELALLRRMLNVATSEGWLIKNPFTQGASLISNADEKKRERIITREEEKALLAACSAPKRGHLRPIIIAALDTGCRLGELLKLRWENVDLESGQIHLIAFNTKTAKPRTVAMTARLRAELEQLKAQAPPEPTRLKTFAESEGSGLVFGVKNNVKRAFEGARKDAGLPDLRFHDLRHSAATRLVQAHIPLSEVGRVLGHSVANTTYRYVNADLETAQRAATALDNFHAETTAEEITTSESVN